ncbi:hypothetical protein GCM10023185_46620 [Hymenobacter saemangeumensis]|uniref:Secretion system C-terminal sorting domain-containing protein n=2 Tax=Hymenobacter saemangeumensis TaxID=1084522 RepID=A0ABP8ITF4_9BACT
MANVTVAPNTTQTLQTGPNRYYPQVVIQNRGRAIVNDEVFIQRLEVQSGGILQVTLNGMVNGAVFQDTNGDGIEDPLPTSYNLRAGAIVEIAIPQGLPFQQFLAYSIDPAANYVFNGSTPQRTASALPGSPLQPLPGQVGSLTINNPTTVTLAAPVSMRGTLRLQNGVFTLGGQRLTLLATGQSTASILPIRGSLSGSTVTVQRPVSASTNAGVGYRHFSSPMQDAPISDLATASFTPVVNPQYNSTGPSVTPFPNVFGYDQSRVPAGNSPADFDRGWFSPNSTSDIMAPGRGYTVNIAGGQMEDFNGTPTQGPVMVSSQRSTSAQGGWLFAGNPYAAAISWAELGRSGLDNALYVFRSSGQYSGTYASYVNGIANNGGSDTLALGQGFFARVSAANTTGTLTFTDSARVLPRSQPLLLRGGDTRPRLTLGLSPAGSGSSQVQTTVYFENAATAGFDAQYDAVELLAPGQALGLNTLAGTQALSINGLPVLTGAEVLVPLRLTVARPGTYALQVDALQNLPAGYRAYLRDALTGAYTDLSTAAAATLNLTPGSAAGRYALLFTTQVRVLATAPAELAQLASVYPNPAHGSATLLLPQALRGQQATPVQVLDNLGRVVLTRTLPAGATEALALPLDQLAPGVYSVLAKTANGTVSKRLVVE